MLQSMFCFVGKITALDSTPISLKIHFSSDGPLKFGASAEVRDLDLCAILKQGAPRSTPLSVGDTISVTGKVVFDPAIHSNVCIVSRDGFSRIATTPKTGDSSAASTPAPTAAIAGSAPTFGGGPAGVFGAGSGLNDDDVPF